MKGRTDGSFAREGRWQVHRISVLTACHAERRVGDRFSLADGTSGRRLEPVPLPEHEPAPSALGRNLIQLSPFGMKTFPKVFQMILDFFFRPMDGGGDLLCRARPLLQEGADLTPCGFRFLQLSDYGSGVHPLIIARLLSGRKEGPCFTQEAESRRHEISGLESPSNCGLPPGEATRGESGKGRPAPK